MSEKLEKNDNIREGINVELLKKFEEKKKKLEEVSKNITKLQKEQMSMRSRKSMTYRPFDDDSGTDEDDDVFK